MNIGWKEIIWIGIISLWPVIFSVGYIIWKGSAIPRLVFFVLSVIVGYITMAIVNLLLKVLSHLPIDLVNSKPMMVIGFLGFAAFYVLPVIIVYFLSRKLEVNPKNSTNPPLNSNINPNN